MKLLHGILALLTIISILDAVRSDIIDMAIPSIFGSKDKTYMSCYDCINVTNSECNKIPPNSTSFVKVCDEGANGCVKKLYHDDGYTIMSRECYYGPLKLYRDFRCDGTKMNYAQEKCYLCTDDLCNSSPHLYSTSYIHYMWILSAIFLIIRVPNVF